MALSLEVVKSQLDSKQQRLVNQDVIDEVNRLVDNPDYGEEFLDTYLSSMQALKGYVLNDHARYLNAVKFFSQVEGGSSIIDAYIRVFPERYEQRRRANVPKWEKEGKSIMQSESSRYNRSTLVNEIRRLMTIPVQLIHRHILHEAIISQADLMHTARSEMVRQRAGATLIAELKPAEDQVIKLDIDDGTGSVLQDLAAATQRLAAAEREAVLAGRPLKEVAETNIIEGEVEDISGDD